MIKILLFSLSLLSNLLAQDIPLSWIDSQKQKTNYKKYHSNIEPQGLSNDQEVNIENKLENIILSHNKIFKHLSVKYKNLDRLDIGLGFNASGSLGLFSFGKSSSIELIWRRKENLKKETKEITIDINPLMSTEELHKSLESHINRIVSFQNINNKIKRRITQTLYKDAKKINYFSKLVLETPQIGNWYINSFLRNYYFSSSIGFTEDLSLGYEKRFRFRFKVNQTPLRVEDKKYNPFIMSVMNTLNIIQMRDNLQDGLDLYRCRAMIDFELGFDLFFFSKSIGKGFLVEFQKNDKFSTPIQTKDYLHHRIISKATNSINHLISQKELDGGDFELNQVRYRFALSGELNFVLASIEKSSSIDLHFKRTETDVFDDDDEENKKLNIHNPKSDPIRLKQIDYRNRLKLSFGIPYINKIRMRPSIEYRYRPISQ